MPIVSSIIGGLAAIGGAVIGSTAAAAAGTAITAGVGATAIAGAGVGIASGIKGLASSGGKNQGGGGLTPLGLPAPVDTSTLGTQAQTTANRKRASMTQSIYTSPLGIAGQANIAQKTLLGQ